jgi:cation diffusion facilitator CzcD-associated flavoprotein CzcO
VTTVAGTTLVIGAGPAGLAAAAELRRRGVPAEIIERNDVIASAWRLRYDRLRLNTCRWNSTLSGDRFPKGTPVFPVRDEYIRYLESYVQRHELPVRFGIQVDRIGRRGARWRLATSAGDLTADHVIVATGHQHTPRLPDWPGLRQYQGRVLHSARYRNPGPFRGADVLVAGAGSSALDIAYDLAQGGAARVRVSVRSLPHMLLRSSGPLPSDLLALALFPMPARLADQVARLVRRRTVGDLAAWGLTAPREGPFTHTKRTGRTPTIVDGTVIEAIRAGRLEIVADVSSVIADGVQLADGTALQPDAIIAATGFSTGLEPMAGHLGVLDDRGMPLAFGGPAVAPGLRFTGYVPNIRNLDREARSVAEQVSRELAVAGSASPEPATAIPAGPVGAEDSLTPDDLAMLTDREPMLPADSKVSRRARP